MELTDPIKNVGDQEAFYFAFAIVKDLGTPVGMFSTSWIGMFENTSAVKFRQTKCIGSKMSRYPVKDHADPCFMKLIDHVHKVLGSSVTGSGCIVSGHLISPGTIKGMLCNSHQLNMSKFHFLQIVHHTIRKLSVIIKSFVFSSGMSHERTDVTLVNCHGHTIGIGLFSFFHPFIIVPFKA